MVLGSRGLGKVEKGYPQAQKPRERPAIGLWRGQERLVSRWEAMQNQEGEGALGAQGEE